MDDLSKFAARVLAKTTAKACVPAAVICGLLLGACDGVPAGPAQCDDGAFCGEQQADSADGAPFAGDAADAPHGSRRVDTLLPCEVEPIVRERCGLCHGEAPSYGAPMSLASHADFAAQAPSSELQTTADAVRSRIHEATPSRRMPPVGQPALTAEELSTLDAWLSQGAPARVGSCEGSGPDAGTTPVEPVRDSSLSCFSLLAHAPGDKNAPYQVGQVTDSYVNFTFTPPWQGTLYAHELHTLIDNPKVVHHWLLYKNTSLGNDGAVNPSAGAHPGAELMFGWAPGGGDLFLDTLDASGDVGLRLEGNVSYTLELHYNSNDASAVDRSGVEVCGREREPANVASNGWLGTDLIFGTSAQGTCDPLSEQPIHIIGIMPHMHTKGTHMRAVISRANGSEEVLHDEPFDFNYQTLYPKDVWLMPGDRITTKCTYSGFATFGEGTSDEMCYIFTLHTPGGSLSDGRPLGTAAHGANACLGL
jgi:hypothetical protein